MDYNKIKEYLADFSKIKKLELVEKKFDSEYEECYDYSAVYKLDDEIYFRLLEYIDSYGENHTVKGVEVVIPKKVTVTDFEAI